MSCTYCGCDPEANHVCERHQKTPILAPNVENRISNPVPVAPAGYIVRDSGQRHQFESGSLRDIDTGKIKWSRITFGPMMRRWAQHLTTAEAKYPDAAPGVPNFTLICTEEEYFRYKESAFRHFMSWYYDEVDEDHASATFFNVNGVEIIKDKWKKGKV